MKKEKNLVLGYIMDLTWYELQLFFMTYAKFCTDAECVVFYVHCSDYALDVLAGMGVKTIKLSEKEDRKLFASLKRIVPFYEFIKVHRDEYAHILFTDLRDVVFQKDFFHIDYLRQKMASGEDYFLVSTEEEIFENDTVNNGMWLRREYGEEIFEKLKDKLIINAGIFCATTNAMLWMLERLIEESKKCRYFVDQTSLNYIIYLTEVPFEVTVNTADHGELVSIGLTDPKDTYLEHDRFLNSSHEMPALIHQYDRPPFTEYQQMLDRLYRPYVAVEKQYEDFASNFDILDMLIRLDKYPEAIAQLGNMLEKNGELKYADARYDKIIDLCAYLQGTPKTGYALDIIEHAAMHMLIVNAQNLTLEPNQIYRLSMLFRLTRTDRSVCRFAWDLASAAGKGGNPKLALEVLRSVKDKVNWDSGFYKFLADICQAAGDKEGALAAYKKFLDVS